MKKDFIVRRSITMVEGKPHVETYSESELVRCKDCRYALPSSENFILCTAPCESQYPKAYKPIDWFCAGGERKEGDGDG